MIDVDVHPLDAISLSLLPEPDAAREFIRLLESGRRPDLCARMAGVRPRDVNQWRRDSEAFNEMCAEAEIIGTATIDDAVRRHIVNAESGWAGAAKTILQQRDDTYSDKQKIEREDTVKYVEVHREEKPEDWEKPA